MNQTGTSADLAALVVSAQAGDRVALEALLTAVRPPVFRYVLSRVVDKASAEDVTQEVTMTVVAALPRYVDTGRSVLAWVFGIAMRKVSEAHRAQRRRLESAVESIPECPGDQAHTDPEQVAYRAETTREMTAALAVLPPPQGEILRLRIAAGLSAHEVAAVLGMTPGAVRVAQHRALARLRTQLASEAAR